MSAAPAAVPEARAGTVDLGALTARSHRISLDPRTKLALLLAVNVLVLGGGGTPLTVAAGVLVAVLLADVVQGRAWWCYTGVFLGSLAVLLLLPLLWRGTAAALVVAVAFWFVRFSVSLGMAGYVIAGTGAGELSAGMSRLGIPRLVVVPFSVVLRFIPLVLSEFRAIADAMRMRGVLPTAGGVMSHPVRTAEYVLVPLLASTTRMADELSASALIRGLDSKGTRTSTVRLGFTATDAAGLAAILGLIVLRAWAGGAHL